MIQVNQKTLHHVMDEDVQDVPLGYKLTEVGIIPENWGVQLLRSCLRATPAYGINAPAVSYSHSLPTYLRITDISEDSRFLPSPKVSVKHPEASGFYLAVGDLVFARTGASVGKSYRYDPDDGPLVFAGFLIKITPNPTELSPAFLAYFVQSKRYWDWVSTVSVRSGQPGINGKEYGSFVLPIPPLGEQCAIAEALSDVDALLGSLDALIAKKRAVKQAAMQQLLAGKTRLPGFNGEWETKRLGELGTTFGGLTGKSKADFGIGAAKYVTFMNVITNTVVDDEIFESVCVSPSENQNRVERGDLLFNGSSETPEEVALCSLMASEVSNLFLNSFCFGFRLREGAQVNGLFLSYYIRSAEGREIMKSLAQGSTRYNLSKKALLAAEVRTPTFSEQTSIASVLSDMDAELGALEARLEKTYAIKQGMMQQLLTGRIRLIEAQAA